MLGGLHAAVARPARAAPRITDGSPGRGRSRSSSALGGLISGIIVFRLAPEAEGHGTDAAIAAFHHNPRGIRARIPFIKLVASAVTIGSGGSGGREGPTAQISAGFGSFLGRFLDLDARDARIAVAVGMAAGIGAIFRAPLGGAVLGAELHYRDDVESDALVPSFIATIVAYSIFGAVEGFSPIFGAQAQLRLLEPRAARLVRADRHRLRPGRAPVHQRLLRHDGSLPAAGRRPVRGSSRRSPGSSSAASGLVIPGVARHRLRLRPGRASTARALLAMPLWMVLALPFAKILATSLSIGSGGSGGIFGPGMVIGGLLGAGIWRLLEPIAPAIPSDPAPFVIVAMMALFGSVAHAPLAVMLMVAEMTGNLSMLAPAMVAVGLADVHRRRAVASTRASWPPVRIRRPTGSGSPCRCWRPCRPAAPRARPASSPGQGDRRHGPGADGGAGVPGAPGGQRAMGRSAGVVDLRRDRGPAGRRDRGAAPDGARADDRARRTASTTPWAPWPTITGTGRRSSPAGASPGSSRSGRDRRRTATP